jgi:RNA polymerase sigma factor (sigma-70 family)
MFETTLFYKNLPEFTAIPDADTKDLLKDYKNNGNLAARNTIIENNIRMVHHIVSKMSLNGSVDTHDLVQTGIMGMIQAIENWQTDSNAKFSVYLYKSVHGYMLNLINDWRNKGQSIHATDEETGMSLENSIQDETITLDEAIKHTEQYHDLITTMNTLPPLDKWIIERRFGIGYTKSFTLDEISKITGLAHTVVRYKEQIGLMEMKKTMKQLAAA